MDPVHQYDQAGLMVRLNTQCRLKTSVQFEEEGPNSPGVVVTNAGYSDWSVQEFPDARTGFRLRIRRLGESGLRIRRYHLRVARALTGGERGMKGDELWQEGFSLSL